ncbi:hypothetical protein DYB32_001279 [Aphanomyces invadans]|uniref:Uncharacterized protein n=1 Tax=Aphanomyces invadans TaxID=157072 RepID=A0A3R6YF44_9STRA|nr:hypothetical protein DYB32_001279 [Aphanomyces invadans]
MSKIAPRPSIARKASIEQKVVDKVLDRVTALGPVPVRSKSPTPLMSQGSRGGTAHNLRRHTAFRPVEPPKRPSAVADAKDSMDEKVRRSSMGLATALFYPQSAADRNESSMITKLMEEKYGFNYLTNEFSANFLVECEYQNYYTQINLTSACNFSLFLWLIWVASTGLDLYLLVNADDGQEDAIQSARRSVYFSLPFLVPTPFLVALCRYKQYEQHMQSIFNVIVHCFALSLMGGGFFCTTDQMKEFTSKNMNLIMEYAIGMNTVANAAIGFVANTTAASMVPGGDPSVVVHMADQSLHFALQTATGGVAFLQNLSYPALGGSPGATIVLANLVLNGTQKFNLNNSTTWWRFPNRHGTLAEILTYFILDVMLPFSQLNSNLVRPIVVLIAAPMFHLNAAHYIVVAFNVNLFYCIVLSMTYPVSSSSFLMRCKFYLVFVLATLTVIMVYRARQSDRFMRLNYLNVRSVKEEVRITQAQKEQIQNENRSLKRMLQAHNAGTNDMLDLDSPMAKVITDLTKIQQNTALDKSLQANLSEIVTLLTKQGHNLFAPDIHEQLKYTRSRVLMLSEASCRGKSGDVDIDDDTKGWATTVLASKSYQRNNNRRSSTQVDEETEGVMASINLHSDVRPPDEDVLSKINAMMIAADVSWRCGRVAEMAQGNPISYVTFVIFERHNLFTSCSVERNVMLNFFWFIDAGYLPNPYGKSNNFLVKSGHSLAVRYSDASVLERMHLAESFFLASEPQFNLFSGMKPKQYTEVRKAIIEMVLTTDLSVHLQLVGSLKTALLSQNKNDVMESPMMLMKIIIKCADIGHSSKSTLLHARWSELIIEEFFLQGDEEKELGMEISPFMNRASENSAKNQVGFFEFIILPFFDVVAEILFTPGFKPILDQVHSNYNLWKKAEMLQLKNIKDILDQVFCVDEHRVGSAQVNRISFVPRPSMSVDDPWYGAIWEAASRNFQELNPENPTVVDLAELETLCVRMGVRLASHDLTQGMYDLDTSGDMVIPLDTFCMWWLARLRSEEATAMAALAAEAAAAAGPPPAHVWEIVVDGTATYYYDHISGETKWDLHEFVGAARAYFATLQDPTITTDDQALMQLFAKHDLSSRGKLDVDEWRGLLLGLGLPVVTFLNERTQVCQWDAPSIPIALVARLGQDVDGNARSPSLDDSFRQWFVAFDVDGDGVLNVAEFTTMMAAFGQVNMTEADGQTAMTKCNIQYWGDMENASAMKATISFDAIAKTWRAWYAKGLLGDWEEASTLDEVGNSRLYYYNWKTRATQWEAPIVTGKLQTLLDQFSAGKDIDIKPTRGPMTLT